MFQNSSLKLPIEIRQGEIYVESVHGKIENEYFILFLTTREKDPGVEVMNTPNIIESAVNKSLHSPDTIIRLFATEDTIRYSEDKKSLLPIDFNEFLTIVELQADYYVTAYSYEHTVCLTGIKCSQSVNPIPFKEIKHTKWD